MTKMIRAVFETTLKLRERDLEELAKQDKAEAGALDKFRKARDQFMATADVVDRKIAQVVNFAFETTVRKDDGKITASEFAAANAKNDDLFDWRGLADDLSGKELFSFVFLFSLNMFLWGNKTDHVDDLSRLV